MSVIDASLFSEKMVIAFEAMGYGACYIGGLRNHLDQIVSLLELPEGVYPLYGLCVGVPDEAPSMRPRLGVDAVLHENRYASDERVFEHVAEYDARYEAYLIARGAEPAAWSKIRSDKYKTPARANLAGVYKAQGASLD